MDNKKRRKKKSLFARCPLALLLVISAAILTIIGIIGINSGKFKNTWGWESPALQAALLRETPDETAESMDDEKETTQGIQIETVPDVPVTSQTQEGETTQPTSSEEGNIITFPATDPTPSASETAATAPNIGGGRVPRPMNYQPRPEAPARSPYYDDPMMTPLDKTYDYITGDDNYFSDALFIGDSRIQGLYFYGGFKTATFAYLEGSMVFQAQTQEFNLSTGGAFTLEQIITSGDYKKIYVMFGLNELGKKTSKQYGQYTGDIIKWIQGLKPSAVITLMGSMPLSTAKSDASEWQNNDNVNSRNYWATVYACDNTDVFYLDDNIPDLLDERGGLGTTFSNDGIHLKAEYYTIWAEHIRKHCLNSDMWQ